MTVVILVFAEVLPKTLAIARTDRFALFVARPLRLVVSVLAPIVRRCSGWCGGCCRCLAWVRTKSRSAEAAHEEIRGSVELHHQEGNVEREHRDMIGGILDLRELKVADVMMHRTNMDKSGCRSAPARIVDAVIDSHHTRVPLWRGEPENIVGVLPPSISRRRLVEHKGDLDAIDVAGLATPPWFVPDTTTPGRAA